MNGLLAVVDMLGETVLALRSRIAELEEQNAVLTRMLGDKPAPEDDDGAPR